MDVMHKSNILLIPILVIVVMSTLFSCGKSDISGSHEILNNLLINEDTSMHKNRLFDVETPYTLCYQNNDGSASIYIFPLPISYKNGNGDLELIDVSLTSVKDTDYKRRGYVFQTKAGDVKSYYPQKANGEITITKGDTSLLSFAINCEPSDECQKAIFRDILGRERSSVIYNSSDDCSFECVPTSTGTVVNISFDKEPKTGEVSFYFGNQSIQSISATNNTAVITPNADPSQICAIRSSYLQDASGNVCFNSMIRFEEYGQKVKCIVEMDKDFLKNSELTYPLSISLAFDVLANSLPNITAYSDKPNDTLSNYSVIGPNTFYGEGSLYMKFRIGYVLKSYEQNVKNASLCFVALGGSKSDVKIKSERLNEFWTYTTPELPVGYMEENSICVSNVGAYRFDITNYVKACIHDDTQNTEDFGLLISAISDEAKVISNYNNALYLPYIKIDFYDVPWAFEKVEKINP